MARQVADFPGAPREALDIAKGGFIDTVGVLLAARNDPAVHPVQALALEGAPSGEATVLASELRTRAADAALVNATAAHALAMDDVAFACHPSAMLVPALLAAGEAADSSGLQALNAYVVGYELLAGMRLRESGAGTASAWHASGIAGPVAVAGAVCHLWGLPPEQTEHALNIAASMSGGLFANFGTPTKALHVGRAAASGIQAATLAKRGLPASPQAVAALLKAASTGSIDLSATSSDTISLHILAHGLSVKKYPIAYVTHRLVDAAVDIAAKPGFAPAQVASIGVAIGSRQAALAGKHDPRTPLEAKYSVEFAVAGGLLAGGVGLAQLRQDFLDDPQLQRLMASTTITLLEARDPEDPLFSPSDRLRVIMKNGKVLDSGEVAYARGHAHLPMAEADRRRKFDDCLAAGSFGDGARLYHSLQNLDSLPALRRLFQHPTA